MVFTIVNQDWHTIMTEKKNHYRLSTGLFIAVWLYLNFCSARNDPIPLFSSVLGKVSGLRDWQRV